MLDAHFYGYDYHGKQPSELLKVNLQLRSAAQLGHIDSWLVDHLAIPPENMQRVQDRTAGTEIDDVSAALERVLLLYGELLRAQNVPSFDHGRIIDVRPLKGASPPSYALTISLPVVDNFPPTIFRELFALAVNLVLGRLSQKPSSEAARNLFADLENTAFPRFGFDQTFAKVTVSVAALLFQQDAPFRHIGGGVIMIGQASKSLHLQNCTVGTDSSIGAGIAHDKRQTARLLRTAGMPTPQHIRVNSHQDAFEAAEQLGWPVVIKPADLERSTGVTVDITNRQELAVAYDRARRLTKTVLVERQIAGVCHRILVANGKVVYAVKRNPKAVIGNGRDTVARLIEVSNTRLNRSPPWKRLIAFPADELAERCLAKAGLSMDAIPDVGQWAVLRPYVSEEWGGAIDDLTARIHPENARLAIAASQALGLAIAGVDLMSVDVSKPWHKNGAVIIEMNHNPQFTTLGRRAAEDAFVSAVIGGDGRIPVHLVTGHGDILARARDLRTDLSRLGGTFHLTTESHSEDEAGLELVMPHATLFDRSLALLIRRDVAGLILVASASEVFARGLAVDRLDSISVVDDRPGRRQRLVEALSQRFPYAVLNS